MMRGGGRMGAWWEAVAVGERAVWSSGELDRGTWIKATEGGYY